MGHTTRDKVSFIRLVSAGRTENRVTLVVVTHSTPPNFKVCRMHDLESSSRSSSPGLDDQPDGARDGIRNRRKEVKA